MGEPRERPILMSGPMVRAILEGWKSQTRRAVKHPHIECADRFAFAPEFGRWEMGETHHGPVAHVGFLRCPFGVPGDLLWVRETWCFAHPEYHDQSEGVRRGDRPVRDKMPWWCHYAATDDDVDEPKWSPSIHMPRWASRITLRVTSVRVERVQAISEEDARAEGMDWSSPHPYGEKWTDDDREDPRQVGYPRSDASFARDNFRRLWDSINGKRPGAAWRDNPWVWAVGFEVERRAP